MSKEEAIEILSDMRCECNLFGDEEEATRYHALSWAINAMNTEPKHGRWITVSDGYGNGVATASICECSLCKDTIWVYKNDKRKWKYCPNCGAKMDEVEE